MVFKNFLLRSFMSLFLVAIYTFFIIINFSFTFYLIFTIYIIIFFEIFLFFKKQKFLILLYLLHSFILFNFISFTDELFYSINLLFLIIISFDTFSYFTGKIFGKNRILKKISPNKTLEGLLGGIFFSILISLLFYLIFDPMLKINIYLFITIIIISSFLGDVIESYFKRINNLKNSSNFLPGHGGFFDRFDSFILCISVYSIINYII